MKKSVNNNSCSTEIWLKASVPISLYRQDNLTRMAAVETLEISLYTYGTLFLWRQAFFGDVSTSETI